MSEMKKLKMVGWYNPGQLARTGYEVLVSAMFGKHSDKRVIQAIADTGAEFVSVGALTHSAPAVDISFEIEPAPAT